MKGIILVFCTLFSITAFTQIEHNDKKAIRCVMKLQQKAWNKGDLEGFMDGYWKSDSLKFIGSKGLTYGWQKTFDNYKSTYSSPEKMGKLTFTEISIESLGKDYVLLIGKWHLKRKEEGDLEGHYSLVWKRIDGEWKIIADHSS